LGTFQYSDNTADEKYAENEGDDDWRQSTVWAVGCQQQWQPYANDITEYGGEPYHTERRHIVAKPQPSNDDGNEKGR